MKDKILISLYIITFIVNVVYAIVLFIPILLTLALLATILYFVKGPDAVSNLVDFYLEYVFTLPIIIFVGLIVPLFNKK